MKRLTCFVVVLATAGSACGAQAHPNHARQNAAIERVAARTPLRIGAVVPELLDINLQDLTIQLMKSASLADVGRVTVTWRKGQKTVDPGLLGDLRTGIDKARAAGIDTYLDVYPDGSSQTPNAAADRNAFVSWTASIVSGLPGLKHVIVGNESNLNLFWMPQYGPRGTNLAAPGYERLLAATYDAVKKAAPTVEVVGGALAHSGTDRPGTGRDTHSPAQFILDMGKAYRASKRSKPIMDAFAYHPYMERADLPPTFRHHPSSKTLTIADYGKLVSVLRRAFDGTGQKGSKLPLVYDEFGVEARIPPGRTGSYSGKEPPTTHPVPEATQAKYYEQGFRLAACQPTVRDLMVFRMIDSEFLESFQSGVYYADRETPKSSLRPVAAAAKRFRARVISGCPALLTPRVIVNWQKRTLLTDADVAYVETFHRVSSPSKLVTTINGRAIAGKELRLPTPKLRAGRYRITLRVNATAYKANPVVKVSPTFGR